MGWEYGWRLQEDQIEDPVIAKRSRDFKIFERVSRLRILQEQFPEIGGSDPAAFSGFDPPPCAIEKPRRIAFPLSVFAVSII